MWAMGIAASLVLGLGVAWMQRMALDADYYTGTGERRQVVLADGSHITLNANSAVDVNLTGDGRRITLRKGEAPAAPLQCAGWCLQRNGPGYDLRSAP
jgi:transmembrane sensor